MAIPVYVPFGFIVLVVGGLGLFSKIYRRRQAARTYQPWFPPHHERNVYITLLQHTDPKPHDALLKAALLRRAVADVKRIFRIRDDKAALASLLQKGSIDDELWANFQAAEKELEAEIVEVVTEANTFADGWGQIIFQSAGEIAQNEKQREIYGKIAANRKAIETRLARPKLSLPPDAKASISPANRTLPSITTTPASPASGPTSAKPSTGNEENIPPPSLLNSATGHTAADTPASSTAPSPSRLQANISLPPLTPSKQQSVNSPGGSTSKGSSKKKNKRR